MALIKCKECQKEVSNSVKKCPHCGYDLKQQHMLLQIAIGLAAAFIFYYFEPLSHLFSEKGAISASQESDLQLLEHRHCSLKFGIDAVCGTIINNSNKNKRYVQVQINLYDKHNNQIGSAMANVNNLEPHSKWKFEAMMAEDNVDSYKIKDITGF